MIGMTTMIYNVDSNSIFPPCEDCKVDQQEKQRVEQAKTPNCALTERCVASCAAYGRVCPCAARVAAHAACNAMHELQENSQLFSAGKPNFASFNEEDIVIGEKLGEGGFSNVNLCAIKNGEYAGETFAIKYLKKRAMVDLHQFKHGAADLAVEAYFLHTLDHPHIVKLHGIASGSVETNVATGKECGFFIVVDRLTRTLEATLETFRREKENSHDGLMSRFSGDFRQKKHDELMQRIKIAADIADAMAYLHSLNIIYRDLKPDNIGFDKNGILKLFDFGLAKELKPGLKKSNGKYKLTGNTGSRRYMAPEVAKEAPYDQSVDVYSFGILLWELCSSEKPFFGYSSSKHMHHVVLGGERPRMDAHHTAYWPTNLQWLMNRCWSPVSSVRPTFAEVQSVLQNIMEDVESIPETISEISEVTALVDPPMGGFSLFQPLKRKVRSKTVSDCEEVPVKEGLPDLSPPSKANGRSRSWGFVLRK